MTASTTHSTTRIFKGREGWEARTEIGMGVENRVLVISTYKTTGGVVVTATVNKLTNGLLVWEMFGDYSKRNMYKGVRCTEKTIRDLHQQALEVSDLTMSAATAHYATKKFFSDSCIKHMNGTPTIDAASAEYHARINDCLAMIPSVNEFQGVTVD